METAEIRKLAKLLRKAKRVGITLTDHPCDTSEGRSCFMVKGHREWPYFIRVGKS